MVVKIASLKSDLNREMNGDWIDFPDWEGVSFNVSSFNKPAYQTARDLVLRRLTREYKGKTIPLDVQRAALGKPIAEHILHGWRGLDQEYTPDLARDLLTNPEYREFYNAVQWCANEVAAINIQFEEEAAKNSAPRSAGSSKASAQATG